MVGGIGCLMELKEKKKRKSVRMVVVLFEKNGDLVMKL